MLFAVEVSVTWSRCLYLFQSIFKGSFSPSHSSKRSLSAHRAVKPFNNSSSGNSSHSISMYSLTVPDRTRRLSLSNESMPARWSRSSYGCKGDGSFGVELPFGFAAPFALLDGLTGAPSRLSKELSLLFELAKPFNFNSGSAFGEAGCCGISSFVASALLLSSALPARET